jgi:hypothetical protein
MLPDRIVDLQHWDTNSGTILNHLVDSGWQPGTTPYGIDPDEPIPEIGSDHETQVEPAREPPVARKDLNPESRPQPLQAPPGSAQRPVSSGNSQAPAQREPIPIPICVLPNLDVARRSAFPRETEPDTHPMGFWITLLVLIAIGWSFSSSFPRSSGLLARTTQTEPKTLSSSSLSVPQVRRALPAVPRAVPVLTSDDKPVARAQLVVPRAQLVRLP